jgi:hypothetical protein
MASADDRGIAFVLGILAAILLLVAALLHFLVGVALLFTGASHSAAGSLGSSVIEVVIALLIGFFAVIGRRGRDRTVAAGVVLVVLAIVGWLALGFGGDLLALLAAVLALLSGVLFLVSGR